ncbi:hypothetical protein Hypma_005740 [Hypsizygus marmoreus]|uniref:Uncharacterized protein n=1 Tax=Hypsizygus marmoreus TaxID=39966 RepID=A0A369KBD0_HYPMA|nr:hypothetical protein Hypma_005740 [Hypsizygus marmoreus]
MVFEMIVFDFCILHDAILYRTPDIPTIWLASIDHSKCDAASNHVRHVVSCSIHGSVLILQRSSESLGQLAALSRCPHRLPVTK